MTNRLKQFVFEMLQIANRAVAKAQEKNSKLGIPNVYAKNGKPISIPAHITWSLAGSLPHKQVLYPWIR